MPSDSKSASALRDSAIIITGATALLFVWGYAFEAFRWTNASIPGILQPEVAVQERALVGGILALFFFLPVVLIGWIIDIVIGHRIRRWLVRTWREGLIHQIVLSVLLFAISIAIVRPVAVFSDRYGRRLRVDSITLKGGLQSPVRKGMYCVGRRGSSYVFVDSRDGASRMIYLVAESDVSSLTLIYGR